MAAWSSFLFPKEIFWVSIFFWIYVNEKFKKVGLSNKYLTNRDFLSCHQITWDFYHRRIEKKRADGLICNYSENYGKEKATLLKIEKTTVVRPDFGYFTQKFYSNWDFE